MIKQVDDDIGQLLEMMRSEHVRETAPRQVEQVENERPNSRQIAHPSKVDPERQMDSNIRHGGASVEEKVALKSDPNTVFASESAQQHSRPNRGQHFGVSVGGRHAPPNQPPPSDAFAGLDPFEIHGANGAFVDVVVNPENDRLARAHGSFHQRLADNKVVNGQGEVEGQLVDTAEELPEEFFPEEVRSGPTGVWDTSGLEGEKQITATMVNPLDERLNKA